MRDTVLQTRNVTPLSAALYDKVFYGAFVPNSTEYRDPATGKDGPMLWKTKELLQDLPQLKRMLSIGAGDGMFDTDLLANHPLDAYVAVEPNPHHVAKLHQRISTHPWSSKLVVEDVFDQQLPGEKLGNGNFDAVLLTHCTYFFKDPTAAIRHARSLTSPQGAVIILHQTDDQGVCPFFRTFEKRLGMQWNPQDLRQDHGMSTTTISDNLRAAGIPHYLREETCGIYSDAFFGDGPRDRQISEDLISFFLNTDATQFPDRAVNEMKQYVREHSDEIGGRKMLVHPQGFIVVPNAESAWKPSGMERFE